jgi:hypothetical protein
VTLSVTTQLPDAHKDTVVIKTEGTGMDLDDYDIDEWNLISACDALSEDGVSDDADPPNSNFVEEK